MGEGGGCEPEALLSQWPKDLRTRQLLPFDPTKPRPLGQGVVVGQVGTGGPLDSGPWRVMQKCVCTEIMLPSPARPA